MRTKAEANRVAEQHGASFIANVILCHHSRPGAKLSGLANLLTAGHSVTLPQDIDALCIDGCRASWIVLEEWARRIA